MSREQAALVFSLAAKMVQQSPKLAGIVRIVPSGKRLIGLPLNTEFRALAADGRTAHGLSPLLAILDEVGQVRGPRSEFVDAIVTSQGAHAEPLLLVISTQAASDADLLSIWLDDAQASNDPRIVCHLYAADPDAEATLQLYLNAAIGHVAEYLGDDLPDPMPDPVQSAVLLLTCDLYVNRERQSSEPLYQNKTYSLLLSPYRSMTVL